MHVGLVAVGLVVGFVLVFLVGICLGAAICASAGYCWTFVKYVRNALGASWTVFISSFTDGNEIVSKAFPVAKGSVAQIHGLKSTPELNGQLCQVWRQADDSERVFVTLSEDGSKSVKRENLKTGLLAVSPEGAGMWLGSLGAVTVIAIEEIWRNNGRSPVSAAVVPLLAIIWLLVTLFLDIWLYLPCQNIENITWLPEVYTLGAAAPAGLVLRAGFVLVAFLYGLTNWLYGELLVPHAIALSGGTIKEKADEIIALPIEDVGRSLSRGYQAAVCFALLAIIAPRPRRQIPGPIRTGFHTVKSIVHVMATIMFMICSYHHCVLSVRLHMSIVGGPGLFWETFAHDILTFREVVVAMGPFSICLVVISSQFLYHAIPSPPPPPGRTKEQHQDHQEKEKQKEKEKKKESIGATGISVQDLVHAVCCFQWGAFFFYAIFLCTYSFDFFWAGLLANNPGLALGDSVIRIATT